MCNELRDAGSSVSLLGWFGVLVAQVVHESSRANPSVFDRELESLQRACWHGQKTLRRVIRHLPKISPIPTLVPEARQSTLRPRSRSRAGTGGSGGAVAGSVDSPEDPPGDASGAATGEPVGWSLRGVSKTVRRTASAAYGAVSEAVAAPTPRVHLRMYSRAVIDVHRSLVPLGQWLQAALLGPATVAATAVGTKRTPPAAAASASSSGSGFPAQPPPEWVWERWNRQGGPRLLVPWSSLFSSVSLCQRSAAWLGDERRRAAMASVMSFLWDVLGEVLRRDLMILLETWMAMAEYRLRSQMIDDSGDA